MEELKPCPFCGGEAFVWQTNHKVFIQCSNYDANNHLIQIRAATMNKAIEIWNRRAKDD